MTLRPAAWPTAEAAAKSRLFSPIRVGPVVLAHRTWVPAMVPWRATENGDVTPEVLGWYERFARGRPAAMVVEATGIRDVPSGPLLRIGHDRFIPGLTDLVRVVRTASAGHTQALHSDHRFPRDPAPARSCEVLRALPRDHAFASCGIWARRCGRLRYSRLAREPRCARAIRGTDGA
jgi:hypothetical protein